MPVRFSQVTPVGSEATDEMRIPDAQLFMRNAPVDYMQSRGHTPNPEFVTPITPTDNTCRALPARVLELSHQDSLIVMRKFLAPTWDECIDVIKQIPDPYYGPCTLV
jgi:hypothetical protein